MDAPFQIEGLKVLPEWIDYNGHMNVAYYVLAFDKALDRVCDRIDLGIDYVRRTNASIFVLEAHVTYQREVKAGDPLRVDWLLAGADAKRMHYFMTMRHATEGFVAATSEQVAMHVDLGSRRSSPLPEPHQRQLATILAAHARLPRPAELGRAVGLPRKVAA